MENWCHAELLGMITILFVIRNLQQGHMLHANVAFVANVHGHPAGLQLDPTTFTDIVTCSCLCFVKWCPVLIGIELEMLSLTRNNSSEAAAVRQITEMQEAFFRSTIIQSNWSSFTSFSCH